MPEAPAPKKGKFTFKPRTPVVDNTQQASPQHQVYILLRHFSGSRFLTKKLWNFFYTNRNQIGFRSATLQQQIQSRHLLIFMYLRIAFDAGKSITRANGRGLGPGNRDFFGPCPCDIVSSRQASTFRGPTKVEISGAQLPPSCPSNGFARIKSITYTVPYQSSSIGSFIYISSNGILD